jgi:hypothetical protein
VARDGLLVHDEVKRVVDLAMHAADPARHAEYRRAAWRHLRAEARGAAASDLWRYTADILYLIENPVVREAFFPTDAPRYGVEPAEPADAEAIRAIVRRHEGPRAAAALETWWCRAPEAFRCVRAAGGGVAGFYCMTEARAVRHAVLAGDPVAHAWRGVLEKDPVGREERVLFLRRWLADGAGERPSEVQAACWLDVKRTYMEMRPQLRRVFLVLRDLQPYAAVAQRLGFRPLPEAAVDFDRRAYHTAALDFGPDSVDGWLAQLLAAEVGVGCEMVLDATGRELRVGASRVALTPRETAVLNYLWRREGAIVTRAALLEDVWDPGYDGGSNVVDVVIRSIRRKLGDRASMIQTVRGDGYRLQR